MPSCGERIEYLDVGGCGSGSTWSTYKSASTAAAAAGFGLAKWRDDGGGGCGAGDGCEQFALGRSSLAAASRSAAGCSLGAAGGTAAAAFERTESTSRTTTASRARGGDGFDTCSGDDDAIGPSSDVKIAREIDRRDAAAAAGVNFRKPKWFLRLINEAQYDRVRTQSSSSSSTSTSKGFRYDPTTAAAVDDAVFDAEIQLGAEETTEGRDGGGERGGVDVVSLGCGRAAGGGSGGGHSVAADLIACSSLTLAAAAECKPLIRRPHQQRRVNLADMCVNTDDDDEPPPPLSLGGATGCKVFN